MPHTTINQKQGNEGLDFACVHTHPTSSGSFSCGCLELLDIETLYLVINMLLYNIMLITQLLSAEGEWLDDSP
jgi:hypothetical protein